ncbi:ribonuclease H-like protein, partial [Acephala macrosclerotiorum]
PDSTPPSLFEHKAQHFFIAHHANHEMMIYTDGTLSNNGQIGARAGCAFVFQSAAGMPIPWNPPGGAYCTHGTYFFHLEDVGPTGKPEIPASNRAELRAVVAALGYPRTPGPTGATTALEDANLVITTDSSYVVDGATQWSRIWETNGWKTSGGEEAKNQDLWKLLLERLRTLQSTWCTNISFWHVPRSQNVLADSGAKHAAAFLARRKFGVPSGTSV